MTDATMGRLSRPPHPVLLELLYDPQLAAARRSFLPHLLRIDAAHLVMLGEQELLPRRTAGRLLKVNFQLSEQCRRGEDPVGSPAQHRGLYALYEARYVEELGPEIGGAAHVARSRNDINATVSRLRLRGWLERLLGEGLELARALLDAAGAHRETLMSGFTHFQPAQPTSFGHYLAAVLWEQLRMLQWLADGWRWADRCPMGAAAAFGTSFAIDTQRVATLLGFEAPVESSLDAVASRHHLTFATAAWAAWGVSITRLAMDLQTWAGGGYAFLTWPDDLVSTSSIMPQKRNPYVLENIRGQAVAPLGALVNLLAGMKNVPFTNSVEVSGEAAAHPWPAARQLSSAVRLLALLVREMEVDREAAADFLAGKQITLTALADLLVRRHGLSFRNAHDAVGRLAAELGGREVTPAELQRLQEILQDIAPLAEPLDTDAALAALKPRQVLEAAAFGGGPAPSSVSAQLERQQTSIEELEQRLAGWRRRVEAADRELDQAIAGAISHAEDKES